MNEQESFSSNARAVSHAVVIGHDTKLQYHFALVVVVVAVQLQLAASLRRNEEDIVVAASPGTRSGQSVIRDRPIRVSA